LRKADEKDTEKAQQRDARFEKYKKISAARSVLKTFVVLSKWSQEGAVLIFVL